MAALFPQLPEELETIILQMKDQMDLAAINDAIKMEQDKLNNIRGMLRAFEYKVEEIITTSEERIDDFKKQKKLLEFPKDDQEEQALIWFCKQYGFETEYFNIIRADDNEIFDMVREYKDNYEISYDTTDSEYKESLPEWLEELDGPKDGNTSLVYWTNGHFIDFHQTKYYRKPNRDLTNEFDIENAYIIRETFLDDDDDEDTRVIIHWQLQSDEDDDD